MIRNDQGFRLPLKTLAVLATILSIPFLSFYWLVLARFIPDTIISHKPNWLTPLSLVFYLPFAFVAYTLFANLNLYVYLFTTIASITAAIVGLKWGRFNKFLRLWLVLIIWAIVAFPFFGIGTMT